MRWLRLLVLAPFFALPMLAEGPDWSVRLSEAITRAVAKNPEIANRESRMSAAVDQCDSQSGTLQHQRQQTSAKPASHDRDVDVHSVPLLRERILKRSRPACRQAGPFCFREQALLPLRYCFPHDEQAGAPEMHVGQGVGHTGVQTVTGTCRQTIRGTQ